MLIDSSQNRSGQGRLFLAALAALLLLLAGTILYPDTMTSAGLHVGGLRLSPLGVLMVLALPPVSLYIWKNRSSLRFQALDVFLLGGLAFLGIRGAAAATTSNGVALVFAYCVYALLCYYGFAVIGRNESAVRALLWTLVGLTVIVSAYAMIEFVFDKNIIFDSLISDKVTYRATSLHRTGSTLGQPIVLGTIMVQLAPFLVYFFLRSRNIGSRIRWGVTLLLAVMALWVSYAKASIITAVILTVAAAWISSRKAVAYKKTLVILFGAGLICVLALGMTFYRNAGYNLLSDERREESINLRLRYWGQAPEAIASQPLAGSGLWQGVFQESDWERHAIDNLYLETLVEQGIIGTLLLGGALVLIGRQVWRLIAGGGKYWAVSVTVAASMAAMLITGMASNPLFVWPNMVVFWIEAGLIRALYEKQRTTIART